MFPIDPKIYSIFGLVLDIVGVILISYELLWRPGKAFQLGVIETKIANEQKHKNDLIEMYNKFPRPPYNDEKIKPFVDAANENFSTRRKKLEEKRRQIEQEYPKGYLKNSRNGLSLVVLGFIYQILGIILG